jgi:uncharacterized protein (DUF2384 family)
VEGVLLRSIPKHDPSLDQEPDIRDEINDIFEEPERWLETPNERLGGQKPRELIGTKNEWQLRQLTRMIKHGVTS